LQAIHHQHSAPSLRVRQHTHKQKPEKKVDDKKKKKKSKKMCTRTDGDFISCGLRRHFKQ
jgi:hypothetical protein